MAVVSRNLSSFGGRITLNKGAAIVVWILGVYTTSTFIKEIGIAEPINVLLGAAAQLLLTKGQAPLWRSGERSPGAVAALVIDVLLNAGGLWPYLTNLGQTTVWAMLNDWTGSEAPPTVLSKIILVIVLSTLTAAGPEKLYEQED